MCIIEQKTYYQADGSPRSYESVRPCGNATGSGTCPNTKRVYETARIVETKPEPSSSKKPDVVVTDSKGRTKTYRDIGRRHSHRAKASSSKVVEEPILAERDRPAPSPAFHTRRQSPVNRSSTPNSAPAEMSSFPPTLPPSPPRAGNTNTRRAGIYNDPPSLNIPRAYQNERRPGTPPKPKVSFSERTTEHITPDPNPRRRRPSLSVNTGGRPKSPTRASPGLSRLPSLKQHKRHDSARASPLTEDNEYLNREAAREASRRQQAEAENLRRRREDLVAAANADLDLEAEQVLHRRAAQAQQAQQEPYSRPLRTTRGRESLDSDAWSRHTSPPRPSRPLVPVPPSRFASSSPLAQGSLRRSRDYGHATVHQYHYPDAPSTSTLTSTHTSRRPSDAIRDHGRDVLGRGRDGAAQSYSSRTVVEDSRAQAQGEEEQWQPVFDEYEESERREFARVQGSGGLARREIRRKREGEGREERRREFWE